VLGLARGVGRTGAVARLGAAMVLAAGMLAAGLGWPAAAPTSATATLANSDDPPRPRPAATVAVDAYGDPLPEGATARLGTVRLATGCGLIAFPPGGRTVLTADTNEDGATTIFRVWEVTTGKLLRQFGGPPARGRLAVSSDARQAVVVNWWTRRAREDRVVFWDVAGGRRVSTPARLPADTSVVAFAPDGKTLAVASRDRVLRLCDRVTGAERARCTGAPAQWRSLVYSPDGRTLAALSEANEVGLWDAATGAQRQALGKVAISESDVCFSPDGKVLATCFKNTVRLWDCATGKEVQQIKCEAGVWTCAFAPDGKTLATGDARDAEGPVLVRGAVRVWDVASGKQLWSMPAHPYGGFYVAFSADGKTLASGGMSTLRLWDPATGRDLVPLSKHESWVVSVAYQPGGTTLATGSADGTIRLWEAIGR
jgi:WD40 repeat protein